MSNQSNKVDEDFIDPAETPAGQRPRRHTWAEFQESGLLWWANRALHIFGWAIVVATDDDGKFVDAYPVRAEWRGFPQDREDLGYRRLTAWMQKAAPALVEEVERGDG